LEKKVQLQLTADKRCGRLRFALAVLGLRWRRASLEKIVCAAVLDTFFLSSFTSFEKTSLIGTVV
jgi:hypothetical protein